MQGKIGEARLTPAELVRHGGKKPPGSLHDLGHRSTIWKKNNVHQCHHQGTRKDSLGAVAQDPRRRS